MTPFVDLDLARRLERAEGGSCRSFVESRARVDPARGATWMEAAGAWAMFDGPGSPITQTFGLGLFGEVSPDQLDAIEHFFFSRGAETHHEVSPLAGAALFATLAGRGYRPIELTSVMFRPLVAGRGLDAALNPRITVRCAANPDSDLYASVSARGWKNDAPEVAPFVESIARVWLARSDDVASFIAAIDGEPIATGSLSVAQRVGLMAGASTVPEGRRQGAQLALLDARLREAAARGCDLAMMCAAPGSSSQRNAERHGFRIAYTRVKWSREASPCLPRGDRVSSPR